MGLKSTTACLGYQQITDLSLAVGLTVPANATLAIISPETQNVRWRDDGVDPTAAIGFPLVAGAVLSYDGNLKNIRFIESAASAVLNISYYQ